MEMGSWFRFGTLRALGILIFVIAASPPAWSWGTQAHQMVNARAIENLPEPLRTTFGRARFTWWNTQQIRTFWPKMIRPSGSIISRTLTHTTKIHFRYCESIS